MHRGLTSVVVLFRNKLHRKHVCFIIFYKYLTNNIYCSINNLVHVRFVFVFSAIQIVKDFWLKSVCGRFLHNPDVVRFFVQSSCCEIFLCNPVSGSGGAPISVVGDR